MIDYGTTIRLTQKLGTAVFRYNSIECNYCYSHLNFNLFRVVQAAILDFPFSLRVYNLGSLLLSNGLYYRLLKFNKMVCLIPNNTMKLLIYFTYTLLFLI